MGLNVCGTKLSRNALCIFTVSNFADAVSLILNYITIYTIYL